MLYKLHIISCNCTVKYYTYIYRCARSACSERQNRLAIYIVTGDARSPTAKQDSLYTCVLVYICVVVSDYAYMSVCACVSWQRNNYLKIYSQQGNFQQLLRCFLHFTTLGLPSPTTELSHQPVGGGRRGVGHKRRRWEGRRRRRGGRGSETHLYCHYSS